MTQTVDEIIARALFKQRPNQVQLAGPAPIRARADKDAAAVINALASAGYVIVPVEPTDAMLAQGAPYEDDTVPKGQERQYARRVQAIWAAMIEAASPGYLDRRRALKEGK